MQDFELYGRVMQLGWGQKDKTSLASSSPSTLSSSDSFTQEQPRNYHKTTSSTSASDVAYATPNLAALATVRKLVNTLPALQALCKPQNSPKTVAAQDSDKAHRKGKMVGLLLSML